MHLAPTRRQVLCAAGVCLTLPWLEAFAGGQDGKSDGGAPSAQPTPRLLYVFSCNGVWNETFFPAQEGPLGELPPTLAPLAAQRSRLSVLNGMYDAKMPAGHTFCGNFLTGGDEFRSTLPASADQIAAAEIGKETRFSSLQLAPRREVRGANGYETISFDPNGVALPPENRPEELFRRLFVEDSAEAVAAQRQRLVERRSVLDGLLGQARALDGRLGREDRDKLRQYLDSIRGVEQEISRAERFLTTPKPSLDGLRAPPEVEALRSGSAVRGEGSGKREWLRAMYGLMRLAFQTDQTRVISFVAVERISGTLYSELAIKNHHHRVSHMWEQAEGIEWTRKIDLLHQEEFGRFVAELAEVDEGGRPLLDSTAIVYAYEAGNAHAFKPWPTLVVGGGALGLKHDRYHKFPQDMPMANLHLTVLRSLGLPLERFSTSTGTIAELA